MDNRPKLLFLTYYFPPGQESSACVRTGNLARAMSRMGWKVTVVTVHPSLLRNADDIEKVSKDMAHLGIHRIFVKPRWHFLSRGYLKGYNQGVSWFVGKVIRALFYFIGIDLNICWYNEAYKTCAHLKPQDVDVILTTGSPFGIFGLAKKLAGRLDRPFVLDYRDLWTKDNPRKRFTRFELRKENQLLMDCAAVIGVSPSIGSSLKARHKFVGAKWHLITNGYDSVEVAEIKPFSFEYFSIVYAGMLLPPKGSIAPVFAALRCLKDKEHAISNDWGFHYYGPNVDYVRKSAEEFDLQDKMILHGMVPRKEALSAVRGAGVSIVITTVYDKSTLGDRGILTGKIYEIIGLGTPLMVIAPPGSDVEEVIQIVGKGRIFTGNDIEGMVSYLTELMNGKIPVSKDPTAYSWMNIGRKLDKVLRNVVTSAQGKRE